MAEDATARPERKRRALTTQQQLSDSQRSARSTDRAFTISICDYNFGWMQTEQGIASLLFFYAIVRIEQGRGYLI